MPTYLYRAVTAEASKDLDGETTVWPGESIGRASGYLSRSGAKDAGERCGLAFVIVRSEPVAFTLPPEILREQEIADLRDRLVMLTEARAVTQ